MEMSISPSVLVEKTTAAEHDFVGIPAKNVPATVGKEDGGASNVGMFTVKSANDTIMEAKARPNPRPLWMKMWFEGEVCCLFSDSNLGKSILAVQIASLIAKERKVLYFDFELSDKQFQLRYTDDSDKSVFVFPPLLYRVTINSELYDINDFEASVIKDIEMTAIQTEAKIVIIDNLTYLCNSSEKGDLAGMLMMRLMALKRNQGLSLLILAHTPKRPLTNPITQNDLAGSKKLYNFFDSVFAIGKSALDGCLRYIKQIKVRYGEYEYDSDNVAVFEVKKVGSFLQFVPKGFATERQHLKERSDKEDESLLEEVRQLHEQHYPYREIASRLGISESKAYRLIKKL